MTHLSKRGMWHILLRQVAFTAGSLLQHPVPCCHFTSPVPSTITIFTIPSFPSVFFKSHSLQSHSQCFPYWRPGLTNVFITLLTSTKSRHKPVSEINKRKAKGAGKNEGWQRRKHRLRAIRHVGKALENTFNLYVNIRCARLYVPSLKRGRCLVYLS